MGFYPNSFDKVLNLLLMTQFKVKKSLKDDSCKIMAKCMIYSMLNLVELNTLNVNI